MGLEVFRINENGAGWVSFDEITDDEKIDFELGLMTNEIKMLCAICLVVIPNGSGFFCETHNDEKSV